MPCRPVLAALAVSFALALGAAACASSGAGPTGPVGAPPPRVGAVAVDPAAGPIGTVFTLTVKGLKQDEAVAFEITFPGEGMAFPGAALTVPPDGIASTTYRATTANQPGVYVVRLTGPPGSLAEGRFTVTDGPPVQSALPSEDTGPSTSGRTGTTARSGRTTTTVKGGSTTSTSTKASTSSSRRVTTSSVTATTKPTSTSR